MKQKQWDELKRLHEARTALIDWVRRMGVE